MNIKTYIYRDEIIVCSVKDTIDYEFNYLIKQEQNIVQLNANNKNQIANENMQMLTN